MYAILIHMSKNVLRTIEAEILKVAKLLNPRHRRSYEKGVHCFSSHTGGKCVKTITGCGCARNCQRVPFNRFYDAIEFDSESNANKTVTKVVMQSLHL